MSERDDSAVAPGDDPRPDNDQVWRGQLEGLFHEALRWEAYYRSLTAHPDGGGDGRVANALALARLLRASVDAMADGNENAVAALEKPAVRYLVDSEKRLFGGTRVQAQLVGADGGVLSVPFSDLVSSTNRPLRVESYESTVAYWLRRGSTDGALAQTLLLFFAPPFGLHHLLDEQTPPRVIDWESDLRMTTGVVRKWRDGGGRETDAEGLIHRAAMALGISRNRAKGLFDFKQKRIDKHR